MSETKRRVVVRRGRQWASPLQGSSAEANELARLLRERVQSADLTLNDLYARLTPDHFPHGPVPSRATLGRRLSGERLETDWDLVEAILFVTTPDPAERQVRRDQARDLWNKARHNPTDPDDEESEDGDDESEDQPPATDSYELNGANPLVLSGEFHAPVTINIGQQELVDAQAELLEARRQQLEAKERLHRSELALSRIMRVLDEEPGTSMDRVRARVTELLQAPTHI